MDIWTLIVINRGVYLRKKLASDIYFIQFVSDLVVFIHRLSPYKVI